MNRFLSFKKNKNGLTLIETLLAVSIFFLIFGAVLSFMVMGKEYFLGVSAQIELQQDLRRGLRFMANDLSESSLQYLKDGSGNSLNLVRQEQLANGTYVLKCSPVDEECVYSTIRFKTPTNWTDGVPSQWSSYINYTFTSDGLEREGSLIVSNVTWINKSVSADYDGNGFPDYAHDPNAYGSGIEKISTKQIKISLVAERGYYKNRTVEKEISGIIYLRN
jgi:type II secretory pathway component PulJ